MLQHSGKDVAFAQLAVLGEVVRTCVLCLMTFAAFTAGPQVGDVSFWTA